MVNLSSPKLQEKDKLDLPGLFATSMSAAANNNKGKLYVVGVGPGSHEHMTFRARQAIEESEVIIGYDTYVSLVEDLISNKDVYRYPMTQEVDRANQAIDFAEKGRIVSVVSSSRPFFRGDRFCFARRRSPGLVGRTHDSTNGDASNFFLRASKTSEGRARLRRE